MKCVICQSPIHAVLRSEMVDAKEINKARSTFKAWQTTQRKQILHSETETQLRPTAVENKWMDYNDRHILVVVKKKEYRAAWNKLYADISRKYGWS
jgi:hypothetical protein